MSIYEVHLGSWRRMPEDGRPLARRTASWPSQLRRLRRRPRLHPRRADAGGRAPLRRLVGLPGRRLLRARRARSARPTTSARSSTRCHQRGIGVIVDWVPAHFPKDEWALARFDGTALYEHADPRQGEHPDWGTLVFNYGRNEVRNFLVANALYWLEEFHVDGLRVDAVASMLYLDYSREAGRVGAQRATAAARTSRRSPSCRRSNTVVHGAHPGVLTIAEESTAWPGRVAARCTSAASASATSGTWAGCTTRSRTSRQDPVHRRYHHNELTFGLVYAWSENFVLPLSHDEVVHLQGLAARQDAGRPTGSSFANLRALLRVDVGPPRQAAAVHGRRARAGAASGSTTRSLDWHLLDDPRARRRAVARPRPQPRRSRASRRCGRATSRPTGSAGSTPTTATTACSRSLRFGPDGGRPPVVCVANLTPVPRHGYRLGLPAGGRWREVLDTDADRLRRQRRRQRRGVAPTPTPWHGFPQSLAAHAAAARRRRSGSPPDLIRASGSRTARSGPRHRSA